MADTGQPDLDLVEALRAGDSAAFETLYRRHEDWVVSLAFRFTGNREDALDVLQETFTYFIRKLPGFELKSRMRTFLYPVVKHLALDRRRASRRQVPLVAEVDLPAEEPRRSDVAEILSGLSDVERETALLRFADGLDLAEIAEVLGVPLGTVKSRLHSAIKNLRKRLA